MHAGPPEEVLRRSPVAPPVVELGRLAGWEPLPLSVRDARRRAGALRERLAGRQPPAGPGPAAGPAAEVHDLVVRYGRAVALRGISLDLRRGEVVALMGRNGAGKSTLLKTLVGLRRPDAGVVRVGAQVPADLPPERLLHHVGLVPQVPGDLLYAATVTDECTNADADGHAEPGTTWATFQRLSPGVPAGMHPRDLSEGQRLTLALAVVLAARPPVLLLDEPTRGLDYTAKRRLVEILRDLACSQGAGHTVLLATHDVELVAEVATRVLMLADGELVTDAPTTEAVAASPAFAPQVAKVLSPQRWLTPSSVAAALAAADDPAAVGR